MFMNRFHNRARALFSALLLAAALAMPGCPRPPEELVKRELVHDGRDRSYWFFAPAAAETDTPLPLVIALHRFTEDGAAMARLTGFNAVAEREGFIVAYPNGLGRRFNTDEGGVDDVAFVLAVIDDLAAVYPVDRGRVYLVGASNGGFLTYKAVCETPETFAAAAVVMGAMQGDIAENCAEGPPMPMLIVHGTADPIVPYDAENVFAGRPLAVLPVQEAVAFWVARNGCDATPVLSDLPDTDPEDGSTVTEAAYTGGDGGSEVVLYQVAGGGHTWPGGTRITPQFITGGQNRDFSASDAIWAFFSRFARE